YLTSLGNYATTTGTALSISTSTASFNGLTLGSTFAVSANGILVTPTVSGRLNNAGLTNSAITINGTVFSLGDDKTITAASSTLLSDSNTFGGANTFSSTTLNGNTTLANATSSTFAITGISGTLLKTLSDGAVVAAQSGVDYQPAGNYATFGYLFPGNATTTQIAFNGGATFAGATSTSFAVTGSTTINTLNLT